MLYNRQLREIVNRRFKASKLNLTDFAASINYDFQRLRYFLNGGVLDTDNFIMLCKSLNVSPDLCDAVKITPQYGQLQNILQVIQSDESLSVAEQVFLRRFFSETYQTFLDLQWSLKEQGDSE